MALKIKTARDSVGNAELSIMNDLGQKIEGSNSTSAHIITLLGSFDHQGPDGTHLLTFRCVQGRSRRRRRRRSISAIIMVNLINTMDQWNLRGNQFRFGGPFGESVSSNTSLRRLQRRFLAVMSLVRYEPWGDAFGGGCIESIFESIAVFSLVCVCVCVYAQFSL